MDVTKVLNYLNIPWSQDTTLYVMETSEFLTKATTTPLKEK